MIWWADKNHLTDGVRVWRHPSTVSLFRELFGRLFRYVMRGNN